MNEATCSRGWVTRCPAARGPKCQCACGGVNHGRDHDGRPQTEAFPPAVVRTPSPGNRTPLPVPEYVRAAEALAERIQAPLVLGPIGEDPYR